MRSTAPLPSISRTKSNVQPLSVEERTIRTMIESCNCRITRAQQERDMLVALLPDNSDNAKEALADVNEYIDSILGRTR